LRDEDAELALKICKGEIKTLREFFGEKQLSLDMYHEGSKNMRNKMDEHE
jgi:hypothetical protein